MSIKLEAGKGIRPFKHTNCTFMPVPGYNKNFLNQPLEFEYMKGRILLVPINPGDILDGFRTPLGEVTRVINLKDGKTTEETPPLKPSMDFIVRSESDRKKLLAHRPLIKIGDEKYEVHYEQEEEENIGLQNGFSNWHRMASSHLSSPSVPRIEIPVLLPYDLQATRDKIILTMQ